MDFKELLLINRLNFGIISLTGSLVALLGLVLYANISSSNPYADYAAQTQAVSNRTPASVPDVTATVPKVEAARTLETLKKEIRTFDLDCSGQLAQKSAKSAVPVTVGQIRLRLPNCGEDMAKSAIVNASNGYVATLFQTNGSQVSTDYIHLAEGENVIRLSFQDRLGVPHTSQISFSRTVGP